MTQVSKAIRRGKVRQVIGLILGPVLALTLLLFFNLDPSNPLVTRAAAAAVLMAVWWITEAIPIAATALIPVVLFPVLGVMKGKAVAGIYFNSIIFLFIGGFMVALAMQRWGLHRRIALRIIRLIGTGPSRLILGFMVATAFLSMWISNTATTMMMIPIALAIIARLEEDWGPKKVSRFAVGLLLGIAYAASIGGTATLIGTPPNLSFNRIFQIYFPTAPDITFADWFVFGFPFAVVFLLITWQILSRMYRPSEASVAADRSIFREEARRLGPITFEEKIVLIGFVALAGLWLFRRDIAIGALSIPGWSNLMPAPDFVDDGTVAIAIALLLFLIPSKNRPGQRLLDWDTAVKLPWGIVILFGGGFALASAFLESGLSLWMGQQLGALEYIHPVLIVAAICLMMTFLTELTSNTATTEMILPILGSLAVAIEVNPLLLMIPATLSASCAFMLPVATPPNAIIFGTDRISIQNMVKTGIILNLIGVVLITFAIYLLGNLVLNIDPGSFPGWARPGFGG